MKVIATGKGYYQRRHRPGDEFVLDSEDHFQPSWMVKADEYEKTKLETRPLTLSEIGAGKADSFVAVMHRSRTVQRKEKTPPKPAPSGKRTDLSLNS